MVLLDFTVGNFGPFRDDATLSMGATTVTEHPDNLLADAPGGERVLSSAIVFGPNASGKTFITDAMRVLKGVVQVVDGDIPSSLYTPYRLSEQCRESPVRMRVRLILDGILYDYRVKYRTGEIARESLYHYPNGRRKRVFSRSGPSEFEGTKRRMEAMTTPGKTYLAMASVGADPICSKVRDAITNGFIALSPDLDELVQRSCRFGDGNPGRKEMMVRALGTADLGISDYTYDERGVRPADVTGRIPQDQYEATQLETDTLLTRDICLRHDFTGRVDEGAAVFPIELESAGTACMFGLVAPLIDALENGKVLTMDELGAHLHPSLTRWLVGQFSQGNNPNGAQLIANTHDIGLMDIDGLLRRDQIWFVNKSRVDGASELYRLSDFKGVRKDTDVMRRYLDGRFDAMPAVRHRGAMG